VNGKASKEKRKGNNRFEEFPRKATNSLFPPLNLKQSPDGNQRVWEVGGKEEETEATRQ